MGNILKATYLALALATLSAAAPIPVLDPLAEYLCQVTKNLKSFTTIPHKLGSYYHPLPKPPLQPHNPGTPIVPLPPNPLAQSSTDASGGTGAFLTLKLSTPSFWNSAPDWHTITEPCEGAAARRRNVGEEFD